MIRKGLFGTLFCKPIRYGVAEAGRPEGSGERRTDREYRRNKRGKDL